MPKRNYQNYNSRFCVHWVSWHFNMFITHSLFMCCSIYEGWPDKENILSAKYESSTSSWKLIIGLCVKIQRCIFHYHLAFILFLNYKCWQCQHHEWRKAECWSLACTAVPRATDLNLFRSVVLVIHCAVAQLNECLCWHSLNLWVHLLLWSKNCT
jgi:magnesium-transporting ATPase (P-type)